MAEPTRLTDGLESIDRTASLVDGEATLLSSDASATTANASSVTTCRYIIGEEIARGGMGEVYRAKDTIFGREVAIKVLQARYGPETTAARRFDDEAQITAQLQHPGIPPVHDLGRLPDGRPFLAMKLIQGTTLDHLLKNREDTTLDRSRYLAIFEQICQALAYAHAHHVLHRDLKPANIMVGAFGEVQVMDWGLAKVLHAKSHHFSHADTDHDSPDVLEARGKDSTHTEIHLNHANETLAGSILGTPAYMSPEQARGSVSQMDERTDVFGLGAILSVILTAKPPFEGNSVAGTRQQAARGAIDDCFARLDASGADPELIALCKRCLSSEQTHRPQNAGEVASAIAQHLAAVEERAHRAEIERVQAEAERARAVWQIQEQAKRRRIQFALACSVLGLVIAGGAFAWWSEREAGRKLLREQQVEAETNAERELKSRAIAANLQLAADLRTRLQFGQAQAALRQAEVLAQNGLQDAEPEIEKARSQLDLVARLDQVRYEKWTIFLDHSGKERYKTGEAPKAYQSLLEEFRLSPSNQNVTELSDRIRQSPIRAELVAALEDWATFETDTSLRDKVLEVVRLADPSPWKDRFHNPATWNQPQALQDLANQVRDSQASPQTLGSLGVVMASHRLDPVPMLSVARELYPNSFDLAMIFGHYAKERQQMMSMAAYDSARALRPESYSACNNLASAFLNLEKYDQAIELYKRATELDSKQLGSMLNMMVALLRQKKFQEADEVYRLHLETTSNNDAYLLSNYAALKFHMKDYPAAIRVYQRVIDLDPKWALYHAYQGAALKANGDIEGAIRKYREAIAIDPECSTAYSNYGNLLRERRELPEAIRLLRKSVELEPASHINHNNLGLALQWNGDIPAALEEYTRAQELNPTYAPAAVNIGWAMKQLGRMEEAILAYQRAIRLDPTMALPRLNLGSIYFDQKKYAQAIECAKAAVKLNPQYANAHAMLGESLLLTGDIPEARQHLKEAARLDPRWKEKLKLLPPE